MGIRCGTICGADCGIGRRFGILKFLRDQPESHLIGRQRHGKRDPVIRRLRHQRLHPRHDLIGGDGAALHVPGIDPVVIGQPRVLDGNDDIGSGRRHDPDRDRRRLGDDMGRMGQARRCA